MTSAPAAKPQHTGMKHRRARSITGILAKPATAISEDHATSVPPPDQILPIWPTAASDVTLTPPAAPRLTASEPVSGRPEKPGAYS